jgi:hypothetical protein
MGEAGGGNCFDGLPGARAYIQDMRQGRPCLK